jgi:hypothetical protein
MYLMNWRLKRAASLSWRAKPVAQLAEVAGEDLEVVAEHGRTLGLGQPGVPIGPLVEGPQLTHVEVLVVPQLVKEPARLPGLGTTGGDDERHAGSGVLASIKWRARSALGISPMASCRLRETPTVL